MNRSRFVSYAQTREDVMLWRALREEKPGVYLDVGAGDPTFLSVSRAFYERGWRGISIEPLPEKAALLRQARPDEIVIEAALSDHDGRETFYRVLGPSDTGLSTLDRDVASRSGHEMEAIEVELTTLAAICRDYVSGEVHFLKVDVEGGEAAVLRGADLRVVRPWIILVEATIPLSPEPSAEWEPLLLATDYVPVWFDGLNRFYVARERHAELAPHFRVPPNPFDDYVVWDEAAERLPKVEARLRQLEAELAAQSAPAPATRTRSGLLRRSAEHLRRYLLAPLADELAAIRAEQAALRAQLDELLAGPALDRSVGRAIEAAVVSAAFDYGGTARQQDVL